MPAIDDRGIGTGRTLKMQSWTLPAVGKPNKFAKFELVSPCELHCNMVIHGVARANRQHSTHGLVAITSA